MKVIIRIFALIVLFLLVGNVFHNYFNSDFDEISNTLSDVHFNHQEWRIFNDFYDVIYLDYNVAEVYSNMPTPETGNANLYGEVFINGTPVQGMNVQVVLNGQYKTLVVATNEEGKFNFKLEPGEWTVNAILLTSWKDKPEGDFIFVSELQKQYSTSQYQRSNNTNENRFILQDDVSTKLITLEANEKIEQISPSERQTVTSADDFTIEWKPYEKASFYSVNIWEVKGENDIGSTSSLIAKMRSESASISLSEWLVVDDSENSHVYSFEINAYDEQGKFVSNFNQWESNKIDLVGSVIVGSNCDNLEGHDFCKVLDEGYDYTYGLTAVNMSEFIQKYYVNKLGPIMSRATVRSLLQSENYTELDQYFNHIQESFERNEIEEIEYNKNMVLLGSFRAPEVDNLQKWVSNSSVSPIAHAALGIYHQRLGWEIRGTKFVADTPEENMLQMREHMEIARQSHEQVIKLNPYFQYSYEKLILLSNHVGDDQERTREYLDRAVAINETTYFPRKRYQELLIPRWGGSHLEMRDFSMEILPYIESQPLLRVLLGQEYENRARHLREDKDYIGALAAYDKALFNGANSTRLKWGKWVSDMAKDYPSAIKYSDLLIQMLPEDAQYLTGRGESYSRAKQYEKALKDYNDAVELDPSFAAGWYSLGYHSFWIKKDFAEAEVYFDKSLSFREADHETQYWYAWSLIEQHKREGLDEMRSYVNLCESVECKSDSIAWASEWINCIDDTGNCSLPESDYKHWRFVDEVDPH